MTHPLAGKRVSVVGKFDWYKVDVPAAVARHGGTVVEPSAPHIDFLLVGTGRGGKPPAEAAKVAKRLPSCVVLDPRATAAALAPTRDDFLAAIRAGTPSRRVNDEWDSLFRHAEVTLDLSGEDLRDAHLVGAHLTFCALHRTTIAGRDASYVKLTNKGGSMTGADLAGANLYAAHLRASEDCTFRGSHLNEAWLDDGKHVRADFTGADLREIYGGNTHFDDSRFGGANLTDADLRGSTFTDSDFTGATFTLCHAPGATFDGCIFAGADLRRADLRGATFRDCDLRDADLADAVVRGAIFDNTDLAGVKNLGPTGSREAGPALTAFAALTADSPALQTSVEAVIGEAEHVSLFAGSANARVDRLSGGHRDFDWIHGPTLAARLLAAIDRWPGARVRLDTVTAKGCTTLRGKKLVALAAAAWAEAFGVRTDAIADDAAETERQRQALFARIRAEGARAWNGLHYTERDRLADFRNADLSGADLTGIELDAWEMDLRGATFARSALRGAKIVSQQIGRADFTGCDLREADMRDVHADGATFAGADLRGARLSQGRFRGANFRDADLREAELSATKLTGADFTGANLDGATLADAEYDESTTWPVGFSPPADARRRGEPTDTPSRPAGSMDYAGFVAALSTLAVAARVAEAHAMIADGKTAVAAEAEDGRAFGSVRGATARDRDYACMIAADGVYGCVSGKLAPCGGQRGEACKHLLAVLLLLVRDGRLDAAAAADWLERSRPRKPSPDTQLLSETLSRLAEPNA